jgi:hypothetical protein
MLNPFPCSVLCGGLIGGACSGLMPDGLFGLTGVSKRGSGPRIRGGLTGLIKRGSGARTFGRLTGLVCVTRGPCRFGAPLRIRPSVGPSSGLPGLAASADASLRTGWRYGPERVSSSRRVPARSPEGAPQPRRAELVAFCLTRIAPRLSCPIGNRQSPLMSGH